MALLILYYNGLMVMCIWNCTICTFRLLLQGLLLAFWSMAASYLAVPPPFFIFRDFCKLLHFSLSSHDSSMPSHFSWSLLPTPGKVFGSSSKIQAQYLEGASKNLSMVLKRTLQTAPQENQESFFLLILAHATAGCRNIYKW